MKTVTHPLIRPESLEERRYQLSLALRALDGNSMIVLPTGLGKTAIALLVAASRLYTEGGKILFIAPTKPLVEQHLRFFRRFLLLDGDGDFSMFTGETHPQERKERWEACRVCFATPQVIKNDLIAARYSLRDVSLLIVDECHRAVGNYAYVYLAERYRRDARSPLILAMTASPGGDSARVREVCENLGIRVVETRTEEDEDVRPYVHEREVLFVNVDLPEPLAQAILDLNDLLESRLDHLKRQNYTVPRRERLSMRALELINAQIQRRIREKDRSAFLAASVYAECMKIRHAIALAESQGSVALSRYLEKLTREATSGRGSKASLRLVRDPLFQRLLERSAAWKGEMHPKLQIILDLVRRQLEGFPESRIIIFATYRDTVQLLVDHLTANGYPARRFVGQAAKDQEKGLSQKMQIELLQRFRAGEFKVLIATSVGEEGLDVPSTDMVIFYEAVPSEIRSIQRKGRTGRSGAGRIVVLVTRGTSDEVYRYVSQRKEEAMVEGMRAMRSDAVRQQNAGGRQLSISTFVEEEGPLVVVDDRETASRVVEHLESLGARIRLERLDVGDYAVGERILVERKTARDFMDTLVNRDLFGQLRALADAALRPVLIIEGGDLYGIRDIHPNAIRGTLAAIGVDMGISVFFCRDEAETAEMLCVLARREEEGPGGERKIHHRKASRTPREQLEYIVSAFPSIGPRNARILLEHFGSVQAITNAGEEDLRKVKGIGEKSAEQIFELSRRKYL